MPTISKLELSIQMFWNNHPPPFFHALYAEDQAKIVIRTLGLIEGWLPQRGALRHSFWSGQEHRIELMETRNYLKKSTGTQDFAAPVTHGRRGAWCRLSR